MSDHSVRPEDVLPDGVESTAFNGKMVRKGTIAAFIANIEILENVNSTQEQQSAALNTICELASAVKTIGLHKYVTFKNAQVEQILLDAQVM